MDVRCPQCQTLYELDDEQVGKRAVTLKCSQCQHVFRLGGRTASSQENHRRWMVRRRVEGDILYLSTFDTLHEWIMKREVRADDEISRTGQRWASLGEIGEFQPMFQVVESIAQLGGATSDRTDTSSILTRRPDTPVSTDAVDRTPHRERVRTSIQFGSAQPKARPLRTEDITKKVRPSDIAPDDTAELAADESSEPRRAPGRISFATADISRERPDPPSVAPPAQTSGAAIWIVVVMVAIAAFGAYAWLFQQDDFLRPNPDVVVIGETDQATASELAPMVLEKLEAATAASLTAAHQENDGIWTMWHELASKPFYIALDTAYAEADKASAGFEVNRELQTARVALENGRAEQASRSYRLILGRDPENAAAIAGLGWSLLELGESKQAAEQFKRAIDIDAGEGDAYIGLGSAYRQLGLLQDAYKAYDLYLGRFPKGSKASIASYQMKQLKKQLGM